MMIRKCFYFIVFYSFLFITCFVCANDDNSIKHIGGNTILSYDGESITIYDEDINFETQKCPIGYHIGSAEEWSTVIKLWYEIEGKNYKHIKLLSGEYYNIQEEYEDDEVENRDRGLGLYEFRRDILNKPDNGSGRYYITSSYGYKHYPYIFVYEPVKVYGDYKTYAFGSASLDTCYNIGKCGANLSTRCFKDKDDSQLNNGYSKEYNDAYIFAYNNRITSMPSIEKANMYGGIKRMEIAKMLSNWVKNFGFYQDTKIPCNFTDTSSVKGDLAIAIIESCRYGIMGQGITKFRPYDNMTRGEVATVISRILRKSKYDGGTPYYTNHINTLKTVGILSNSINPNNNELRGNVMVMIMRANDILKYDLFDCNKPSYLTACDGDERNCVEKCKNN